MLISKNQLKEVIGTDKAELVDRYHPALIRCLERYKINTPLRIAHFLAQIAFESGGFQFTEEIWPNPQLDQDGVATNGSSYQLNYEGRVGLGNKYKGDGYKFRGRGLIQLTGRANYIAYGKAIGKNLTSNPSVVSTPQFAIDAAGWFWESRNLNTYADRDDIEAITKRVNGGMLGIDGRRRFLAKAKAALKGGVSTEGGSSWLAPIGIGAGFFLFKKLFL